MITSAANAYNSAVFTLSMDTVTGTRVAGTYTYTAIVTAYSTGTSPQVVTTKTAVVTFTIAALAAESTTPAAGSSSAIISAAGGASVDEAVSALATASTTPAALIEVKLRNASGSSGTVAGKESVTVTTTAGTVTSATTYDCSDLKDSIISDYEYKKNSSTVANVGVGESTGNDSSSFCNASNNSGFNTKGDNNSIFNNQATTPFSNMGTGF
jgi:hypothetical protein